MRLKPLNITILVLLFFVFSCKKNPPAAPVEYEKTAGVFICNEGNFTFSNSSISFYEPETGKINNEIFYNANNFPPGDVCMSMMLKDTLAFAVINNSGKILVFNNVNFKHTATINELTSPRYILPISDTKAYVTDLYDKNITIINPETFRKTGYVYIGNGTEQIVKYGNFAYATGWSFNNKVYKIDIISNKLTDSLTVTKQPNSIAADKYGKLWVLSDGGFPGIPGGQEIPALTRINTETFTVEKVFEFSSVEISAAKLTINKTADTLFFIRKSSAGGDTESGIYKMPVNSENLPATPFIEQGNSLFYGLGTDPYNSDIYVSDAVDYMQEGIVFRFKSDGTPADTFKTGIIPSFFCFKKE